VLHDMNPVEGMELLKSKIKQFKTNAEFLMSMNAERV
jgi:transcription termination factor Rho